MSYIDVRHANFLSLSLTTGEARDLGPRYTTIEDRVPVQEESVEHISLSHRVHVPVEAQNAPGQVAEQV